MDRRRVIAAVALSPLVGAAAARAQQARAARVAWISIDGANTASPFFQAFRRGLADAGWIEGRNVVLDGWWSGGVGAVLDDTIAQALATRPDVIVAAGGLVVRPLIKADVAQPVVFTYSGDAVLGGIVKSYPRPGVNRSGVSLFSLELVPKRIALLKETLPALKRLAIVGWPQHAGEPNEREAAISTARKLGLEHVFVPVSTRDDLDRAFDDVVRERCEALLVFADGVTVNFADRFAAFSRARRIPTISGWAVFAEQGNLMSYGPVLRDCHARLAVYVDRILKGAKASELPVELPATHELVINGKTAAALAIAIPPAILARADRVIA